MLGIETSHMSPHPENVACIKESKRRYLSSEHKRHQDVLSTKGQTPLRLIEAATAQVVPVTEVFQSQLTIQLVTSQPHCACSMIFAGCRKPTLGDPRIKASALNRHLHEKGMCTKAKTLGTKDRTNSGPGSKTASTDFTICGFVCNSGVFWTPTRSGKRLVKVYEEKFVDRG